MYLLVHAAWRQIIGISELFQKEAQDLNWTIFRIGNLGNGKSSLVPGWRRGANISICEGPVGEIAEGYVGDGNTSLGIQRSELAEWLVGEAEKDDSRWTKGFPSVSTALKKKV